MEYSAFEPPDSGAAGPFAAPTGAPAAFAPPTPPSSAPTPPPTLAPPSALADALDASAAPAPHAVADAATPARPTAAAAAPTPTDSPRLAAPTPSLATPVLPPAGGPVDVADFPLDDIHPTPPETSRRRSRVVPLLGLLVLVAAAAGGYFWWSSRDAGSDEPAPRQETPAPRESPSGDAGAVTPIGEARDVVDDINERSGDLAPVLDDLGLDETGNPLPPAETPASAAYSFTWIDPSGQTLDVTVDTGTGDYEFSSDDGLDFRRVDGAHYGANAEDGAWYVLDADPFAEIPVVGLDGLPTVSTVLPADVAPFVLTSRTDGATTTHTVDDVALAAAAPDLRTNWLRPWGLVPDGAPAGSGTFDVEITVAGDGTVTVAAIEAPALGGRAEFRLVETFDVPPVIEIPAG